ncbi:hypothetical protein KY284_020809 [Solanum tuberosum]|nr:hypothetical protein KY284_020809 [Solanum tuberosum]
MDKVTTTSRKVKHTEIKKPTGGVTNKETSPKTPWQTVSFKKRTPHIHGTKVEGNSDKSMSKNSSTTNKVGIPVKLLDAKIDAKAGSGSTLDQKGDITSGNQADNPKN